MASQTNLDRAYMKCAFAIGELSHAKRKKVGAILVSPDRHIIAEGFNGTPSGFNNNCEHFLADCRHQWVPSEQIDSNLHFSYFCVKCSQKISKQTMLGVSKLSELDIETLVTKPEVLHAESNAISKVACSTNSSKDSTLYVTLSPCFDCAKLIIQAKITRVVYSEVYRSDDGEPKLDGISLLTQAGIRCFELEMEL